MSRWNVVLLPLIAICCADSQPDRAERPADRIPASFDKCIAFGGTERELRGKWACHYGVSRNANPELYESCQQAGGGVSVRECHPNDPHCEVNHVCTLRFGRDGGTCHSNFC